MKIKYFSFAALCGAFVFGIMACSNDDVLSNESVSIVGSLNPEDCNDSTEGAMVLLKEEMKMYLCTDGEWNA